MTLKEKREKVHRYCQGVDCSKCVLRVGGWKHSIKPDNCLEIEASPEADLNRALAIINGTDLICPTCRYWDSKYDDTECSGCKNHMRRDALEYDTAPIKWTPLVDMDVVEEDPVNDPVNHPEHYTSGGIECIDAIKASMTPIEYAGFLKGQILKYVWRYRLKGKPVQDLKKANFYLDRLIHLIENEEVTL